ncbi:MAG: substrate-binding domain-containing protein [Candidatus Dormibacteria bacterium]
MLAVALVLPGLLRQGGSALELRVSGPVELAPMLDELAAAYHQANPRVQVLVDPLDATLAGRRVQQGAADLALVDSVPQGLGSRALALEVLAIVVNPQNPVPGLTHQQVADIYAERATLWSDVGGGDGVITPVDFAAGSRSHRLLRSALGLAPAPPVPNAFLARDPAGALDLVAAHPEFVAYVEFRSVDARVRPVAVDGAQATDPDLRAGRYPLAHRVWLALGGNPGAAQFADYCLGPQGRAVVGRYLWPLVAAA